MDCADSGRPGVVVIGRNEGERLRRCLKSLRCPGSIVYVDSGSTDGSPDVARSAGAEVVDLDMQIPFTAARARNAGFARLRQIAPTVPFVQFVDGDCELIDGWLGAAASFLLQHPQVACVCGRLRERFPQRSVYNRLCDAEWDRDAGETAACGGIAMMRATVFDSVGGFRDDMVAGEEPELCHRMRVQGARIWRLEEPMAWHDAAMLRFEQWWKRTRRTGFSYAQRFSVSRVMEPVLVRSMLRAWAWAVVLPLTTGAGSLVWGAPALVLLLAYPLQMLRLAAKGSLPWKLRLEWAFFIVLGKFPEWLGQVQFLVTRAHAKASRSFDYKS